MPLAELGLAISFVELFHLKIERQNYIKTKLTITTKSMT